MKRFDIVSCVLAGDYGKPRPGVIVQSNLFNETHASFILCPITSLLVAAPLFRIPLKPSAENGLKVKSQIMADKMAAISRNKIKEKFGKLALKDQLALEHALKLWLALKSDAIN